MTTAAEHHDAQLAAIKARHAALAAKFSDPAVTSIPEAEIYPATIDQMGLRNVFVDPIGRLWAMTMQGAEMVFDPQVTSAVWEIDPKAGADEAYVYEGLTAAALELKPDPADTQAAQGFPAHVTEHPLISELKADYDGRPPKPESA